jgi:hypothetical protein
MGPSRNLLLLTLALAIALPSLAFADGPIPVRVDPKLREEVFENKTVLPPQLQPAKSKVAERKRRKKKNKREVLVNSAPAQEAPPAHPSRVGRNKRRANRSW